MNLAAGIVIDEVPEKLPYIPLVEYSAYIHEQMVCCGNDTDFCVKYEEPGVRFPTCSRCQFVSYCSKECQTRDWQRHRKSCKEMAKLPGLRKKMMKSVRGHSERVSVLQASLLYRSCQMGSTQADGEGESSWADSDDANGPRRPTFAGCETGVYLPLFSVATDFEKIDRVDVLQDGSPETAQASAESDPAYYTYIPEGFAADGLSYLYAGNVIRSPSQTSSNSSRRLDEGCPGLVYLKALQYDLSCMNAEGAFLTEYSIKDSCGGKTNILSATRFYMPLQINYDQQEAINYNSLLRCGPAGRHANVDPSWMGTVSNVGELSYTACDTNLAGGLCGSIEKKKMEDGAAAASSSSATDDSSSPARRKTRESIRKPAVKDRDAFWSERVQEFVSKEMKKKSDHFLDNNINMK